MTIVKTVKINASDFNDSLDIGEWPENIAEIIEGELERMHQEPGTDDATIQIEIANDFEPEEDEESEDDETETEKE